MLSQVSDFVQEYSKAEHKGQWDAVVSCFFVDTAEHPLVYLRTIKHCLRKGGYWINCGPLLWHHESGLNLSVEELLGAAQRAGLQLVEQRTIPSVSLPVLAAALLQLLRAVFSQVRYCYDSGSLMRTSYELPFWVCQSTDEEHTSVASPEYQ
eukprot:SAG31_NODE_4947_length_2843_cov_1.582362_3_plen_152_part_00